MFIIVQENKIKASYSSLQVHYEVLLQEEELGGGGGGGEQPIPFYTAPPQKGRPRKRKQHDHMEHMLVPHMHGEN